jgi:SpoVK/Ycf46/Vps4 family AAA+-type ATPase
MAVMNELRLVETIHPTRDGMSDYDSLLGIDDQKEALADELALILNPQRFDSWHKKHHASGLAFVDNSRSSAPLILLSGDVGCGKTALASCVATPVARTIDQRIACLETPSDIRGEGYVGELSSRLTEAFAQAKIKASKVGRGILIIDEADDLATRRGQTQAHHEDRAGVNVLIKQIDQLARDTTPIAVIIITNRADVMDPAVLRRAVLRLEFGRPNDDARAAVFNRILDGTGATHAQIRELVNLTSGPVPYTFSDLTVRIGRLALRHAWKNDQPFGVAALRHAIAQVHPSPPMDEARES